MTDKTINDNTLDFISFSLKLETSAESFWECLKRSDNFNIRLSSVEVICSIAKIIIENDDLCGACVTKYNIYSSIFRISKKALKSVKHLNKEHTRTNSCKSRRRHLNFSTKSVSTTKTEDLETESYSSVRELCNNYDDLDMEDKHLETEGFVKEKAVSTSEPVQQVLFQVSDTQHLYDHHNSEKVHQQNTNHEKRYICGICKKTFLRPYLIRKHMKIVHNKNSVLRNGEQFIIVKGVALNELPSHICPICGKKFKKKRYLYNHSKFHTGQKRFGCKICNRGFLWLCHTKKHIKIVHNKDGATTNIDQYVKKLTLVDSNLCDNGQNYIKYNQRAKDHTNSIFCNYCGKSFSQNRILNIHLLQKHSFGSNKPNWSHFQTNSSNGNFSSKKKSIGKIKEVKLKSNISTTSITESLLDKSPQSLLEKSSQSLLDKSSQSLLDKSSQSLLDKSSQSLLDKSCKSDIISENVLNGVIKNSAFDKQQTVAGDMKSFICSYCDKCFIDKILAKLHIFLSHEQDRLNTLTDETGQYVCPVCNKRIGAKRNFKAHLHVHVKERYFMCKMCNKSFLWHSCATRHVKTHGVLDMNQYLKVVTSDNPHGDTDVYQIEQELNKQENKSVETHDNDIHDFSQNVFSCDNNDNVKKDETGTERLDSRINGKTECAVCSRCCKGFMTNGALKEHVKICAVQNQFRCLLCNRLFPTKCNAHRHLYRIHNKEIGEVDHLVEEEPVQKETFVSVVNSFENVAKSESHFMCSVCNKFFRERRYLRQHMWTHRRQCMHKCKYCARYFTKKQFLLKHMANGHPLGGIKSTKVASKSKYLAALMNDLSNSQLCFVCGDSNTNITHDGHMCLSCKNNGARGGLFACGACGIKMKTKHDLLVHSRTHEVREHKCDVCGKIYKQKKLLDIHKKEHSGNLTIMCSRTFSRLMLF